jgi:hypothetical protein
MRGMEEKLGKEATRLHSEKHACPSEEREPASAPHREGQTVANPSEVAKSCGTPNSLTVTCPDVETRALRASRSCHERR